MADITQAPVNYYYKAAGGNQPAYLVAGSSPNVPTGYQQIDLATAQNYLKSLNPYASEDLYNSAANQIMSTPISTIDQQNARNDSLYNLSSKSLIYSNIGGYTGGYQDILNNTPQPSGIVAQGPGGTTQVPVAQLPQIQQEANNNFQLAPPAGSAGDVLLKGGTFQQELQTPTAQKPGVVPVAPGTPAPQTTQTAPGTVADSPFPTTNLQPGSSGPDVKKLQDYLVSQGFMTPEEVATGPGIYGPHTIAAVTALQKKIGVDTAGNPGFWGPLTLAALQGQNTSTQGQTPTGGASGASGAQGSDPNAIASQTAPPTPPTQSPVDFIAQYKQALTDLGIPSILEQFNKVVKEQADLQKEINGKIQDITDNPWMTQGVKDRNIQRIKDGYQTELDRMTHQQTLYDSMYKTGIAEAQFQTTGEMKYQQDLIDYAQKAADAKSKLDEFYATLSEKQILDQATLDEKTASTQKTLAELAGISAQQKANLQKTNAETLKLYQSSDTLSEKPFYADILAVQKNLSSGTQDWGQAYNYIKGKYNTPNDVIDKLLNKAVWSLPGAYQKKILGK